MTVIDTVHHMEELHSSNAVEYVTSGYADADYSNTPFMGFISQVGNYAYWALFDFEGQIAVNDVLWFHCYLHVDEVLTTSAASGVQLSFTDASGATVAELYTVSSTWALRLYGDTTVVSAADDRYTIPSNDANYVIDISVEVTAAALTMSLYINGTLSHTITASNTTANRGAPDRLRATWMYIFDVYSIPVSMTEAIITTNESTVGWRMASLDPFDPGVYSQWAGNYETLTDFDYDKAIEANQTGIRESWGLTNYNGPTIGVNVRGVFMYYEAEAMSLDGPQQIQPFVIVDGVAHDAASHLVGASRTQYLHEWAVNPATGVAWLPTEIGALEFGLRSA